MFNGKQIDLNQFAFNYPLHFIRNKYKLIEALFKFEKDVTISLGMFQYIISLVHMFSV